MPHLPLSLTILAERNPMKPRTEVFVQFILPGSRDDNLEEADRIASLILDSSNALAVSLKLEQVDDGGN
jgi:hypothetical protein